MDKQAASKQLLSVLLTLTVVTVLILAVPAAAVNLSLSVPSMATHKETVHFTLEADIESGERIPIDNITLILDGPTPRQCTFLLDGTPVDGCDGIMIVPTDLANFSEGVREAEGYNGTDDEFTNFGYGYGYAHTTTTELEWEIWWNTTNDAPGTYGVSYLIHSRSDLAARIFGVEPQEAGEILIKTDELCYADVNDIPVTCDGTITYDDPRYTPGGERNNCRNLVCENGDSRTELIACGMPVEGPKTHFEMYLQEQTGEPLEVCVGDTCMNAKYSGFAQSTDLCQPKPDTDASLAVAPFFPQGANYVFQCNVEGFTPVAYDWFFGDGSKLLAVDNDNVYHTFDPGNYTVECVAHGEGFSESATYDVVVDTPAAEISLDMNPWFPQGLNAVLECNTEGFTPTSYDWEFDDGSKLVDITNDNVWHTFPSAGTYEVSCTASDGVTTLTDTRSVTVA